MEDTIKRAFEGVRILYTDSIDEAVIKVIDGNEQEVPGIGTLLMNMGFSFTQGGNKAEQRYCMEGVFSYLNGGNHVIGIGYCPVGQDDFLIVERIGMRTKITFSDTSATPRVYAVAKKLLADGHVIGIIPDKSGKLLYFSKSRDKLNVYTYSLLT